MGSQPAAKVVETSPTSQGAGPLSLPNAPASCPDAFTGNAYGLQVAGWVEVLGLRHNGPNPVVALGTLIIAFGPARCSPLNGVGLVGSKPHALASLGLLNQNPTWKVLVKNSDTAGSKPKI